MVRVGFVLGSVLPHVSFAGISLLRSGFSFVIVAVEFEVDRLALWHVSVFGILSLKCDSIFRRGNVRYLMASSIRQHLTSEVRIRFQDSPVQFDVCVTVRH
jgi:hypothetical protein